MIIINPKDDLLNYYINEEREVEHETKEVDILDIPINSSRYSYFIGTLTAEDVPVKWKTINWKIYVTDRISVVDRNTGRLYYLVLRSNITGIYIFAGKGGRSALMIAKYLVKVYGGREEDWFHARGRCFVYVNDNPEECDLHWFECAQVGSVRREIKEWYTGREKIVTNIDIPVKEQTEILVEDGIVTEGENIIKRSKIAEIANMAKKLLDKEDFNGFINLIDDSAEKELSLDEQRILLQTEITNKHDTILDMLCHVDIMNSPDVFDDTQ